ncbi:hypothetical protein ATY81_21755 [Rhizobium sp. R72]|nr:hypothetical protein ATY81_21755 [Rhizobium sp. R72]OWW02837.1 hypothetical protein ATY80_21755 [Rhizobium sp. R711]
MNDRRKQVRTAAATRPSANNRRHGTADRRREFARFHLAGIAIFGAVNQEATLGSAGECNDIARLEAHLIRRQRKPDGAPGNAIVAQ